MLRSTDSSEMQSTKARRKVLSSLQMCALTLKNVGVYHNRICILNSMLAIADWCNHVIDCNVTRQEVLSVLLAS